MCLVCASKKWNLTLFFVVGLKQIMPPFCCALHTAHSSLLTVSQLCGRPLAWRPAPCWLLVLLTEKPFHSEVQYVATFCCKVNFRIARYKKYFCVSLEVCLLSFVFGTQFGFSFACIVEGQIFEIPSNNHSRFSVLLLVMGKRSDHSHLLEGWDRLALSSLFYFGFKDFLALTGTGRFSLFTFLSVPRRVG